jgi:hypothetical protein
MLETVISRHSNMLETVISRHSNMLETVISRHSNMLETVICLIYDLLFISKGLVAEEFNIHNLFMPQCS